eukprot:gene10401-13970_t
MSTLASMTFDEDSDNDDEIANKQPTRNNSRKVKATEDKAENQINNANNSEEIVPEELLKKKREPSKKPFTEDLLISSEGLQRIYEDFPRYQQFHGRGSEAKDIARLMDKYKEWAFQLHPGMAFIDVINKCETFGSRAVIKSKLVRLRETERDRYMREVLKIPISTTTISRNQPNNLDKKTDYSSSDSEDDAIKNRSSKSKIVDSPPSTNQLGTNLQNKRRRVYESDEEEEMQFEPIKLSDGLSSNIKPPISFSDDDSSDDIKLNNNDAINSQESFYNNESPDSSALLTSPEAS